MWCCFDAARRGGVFLSSAKLPTSASGPTCEPGRRWLKGPIRRAVLDLGRLDDATPRRRSRAPIVLSTICAAGADRGPLPDRRRAAEDDVRLEDDVRARASTVGVDVDRRGVAHRHAGAHVVAR